MRRLMQVGVVAVLGMNSVCSAQAAEDIMQFYREEAEVISASRLPQPANQPLASVHILTQEDIKASGAQTIWDALRSIPSLDVINTRTAQGEISIRGLDRPINNRVLVLLDGRPVLNDFFDHVVWESLPVHLDEIERIEVVEGPVSAVYGANAVTGVIHIITKSPEELNGGQVRYSGGERNYQQSSFTYGKKQDQLGYKFGGGWHSTNRFEDADQFAGNSGHFSSTLNYDFSEKSALDLSGGLSQYATQISLGELGPLFDDGLSSFMRGNYQWHDTTVKSYWNHLRSQWQDNVLSGSRSDADLDSYDASVEQKVSLPWRNQAVFGSSYHRIDAHSDIIDGGSVSQDLWSAFLEDKWEVSKRWMLLLSGRVDRHPLTPIRFSPRGSLLYMPVPEHVFRVSAGTSFRNPTLMENYIESRPFPVAAPAPPGFTEIQNQLVGNRTLDPESLESVEVAHNSYFGRFKTGITGYHYKFRDALAPGAAQPTPVQIPPVFNLEQPFVNVPTGSDFLEKRSGTWGGDAEIEYLMTSWLRLMANYSYFYGYGEGQGAAVAKQSPRHKANLGFRAKNSGWTTQWMVHWVDKTTWQATGTPGQPVNAYFLVNAYLGYAFLGRWNGLEAGVSAFNLLNHDHYEVAPVQGGEIIRSRIVGTLSYKF